MPFINLAKTSSTILNRSDQSLCPCLVPDSREKVFNLSLSNLMLAVVFSHIAFIMLKYVPSMPNLIRILIIDEYCVFSGDFYVYRNDHMIFDFIMLL